MISLACLEAIVRISLDFEGHLLFSSLNKHLLVIVDEFSRFPFAYICKDACWDSDKFLYRSLFLAFGIRYYIHSHRGTSFMSYKLKIFLMRHSVSTSRTSPYHFTGNIQCERFVVIIWKTITLSIEAKTLPVKY